ncbi:MAG: helix-turn-helix domain-containing protein [Mycobacterium sp.]
MQTEELKGTRADLATIFGRQLRKARAALHLTQADVAERIQITEEGYGRIDRGAQPPSLRTLCRLVVELGVTPNFLFGIDDAGLELSRLGTRQQELRADVRAFARRLQRADPDIVPIISRLMTILERGGIEVTP